MHQINTSTLKLNASRGISRIPEQGLEPLPRLSTACLPTLYSKPSGASVTLWWAAVSFQGRTLGSAPVSLCSCICLRVFHVERSIWFIHFKKWVKKNSCSTLGGFKDRRIKCKGNKWCAFDSRAPRSWFFWLVVINHNFSDHPNSKADTLLWFHPFLSTWYLSFCHLLVDDQQKRKLKFLLSNFNWQMSSCNINVQGEHFRLGGHLYPLFRSLEFITRLLLVSLG